MNHVRAWLAGLLLPAFLSGCGAAGERAPAPLPSARPNILFIFTDDHAAHAISAYGSKINKTPNLDRIAKEGMIFRNCFVTNSICAPSRAVILTGKHSHLNGQIDNRVTFDGSQQTFPKLLRKAGYQTVMIGKWHLKSAPTGFDFWKVLIGQGPYYNPPMRTPKGREAHTGYTTDIITDIALDWLKNKRDSEKPFMLMYQHKAPHREWAPGPKYLTKYDGVEIPEPPTLFDDYKGRTTAARQQSMTIARHMNARDLKLVPPPNLTESQLEKWNAAYGPKNEAFRKANLKGKDLVRWKYQRYVKDYLRSVDSVDENVGRVLDYLDEAGLAENTVVIYSSDQGWYLGDHGWFDKRWMYEESFRMPLLVRWPAVIRPGSENTDLVQNLDFAETFLDLARAPVPDDMQGRSIVPLLRGKTPSDWRTSVYYHYYEFPGWHDVRRHYGVRTARYKLIRYYSIDEWELFDLEKDPDELRSVYEDRAYAPVVRQLKAELTRLRKQYKVEEFEEPPAPPDPRKVKLARIVHWEASRISGGKVGDTSGNRRDGTLVGVSPADGRKGKAFRFDGRGMIRFRPKPPDLDPTFRPLTVGAWCRPESGDGIVFSHGNERFGYALYLKGGRPTFTVRIYGLPYTAAASSPVSNGEWAHLAGTIDPEGRLAVWVNGKAAGRLDEVAFVSQNSRAAIRAGADPSNRIGEYTTAPSFKGLMEDVRLYWGAMTPAQLRSWAR